MTLLIHNLVVASSVTRQEMTLKMQQNCSNVRSQRVESSLQAMLVGGMNFLWVERTTDAYSIASLVAIVECCGICESRRSIAMRTTKIPQAYSLEMLMITWRSACHQVLGTIPPMGG
jgi:hypothetical protein